MTPSSALYVGPIAVESSTTLKARAYRTDWSPSATMTESYALTLDTTRSGASAAICSRDSRPHLRLDSLPRRPPGDT
ncbi:MAG: FN3 associated domain-containing protein [Vicinamibacterales bacterium]